VNDYWYITKDGAQNILDSIVRAAEESEFRVAESDKTTKRLALEDTSSNARTLVQLENQTLHITSRNPHDRLTSEYRVFIKRESMFINKVSTAEFIW